MKNCEIYRVFHPKLKKYYVGSHYLGKKFEDNYKGSGKIITHLFENGYPEKEWIKEQLEVFEIGQEEDINERERIELHWLEKLDCVNNPDYLNLTSTTKNYSSKKLFKEEHDALKKKKKRVIEYRLTPRFSVEAKVKWIEKDEYKKVEWIEKDGFGPVIDEVAHVRIPKLSDDWGFDAWVDRFPVKVSISKNDDNEWDYGNGFIECNSKDDFDTSSRWTNGFLMCSWQEGNPKKVMSGRELFWYLTEMVQTEKRIANVTKVFIAVERTKELLRSLGIKVEEVGYTYAISEYTENVDIIAVLEVNGVVSSFQFAGTNFKLDEEEDWGWYNCYFGDVYPDVVRGKKYYKFNVRKKFCRHWE